MWHRFLSLSKHGYPLFIAATLTIFAIVILSSVFGVLFAVQKLNQSLAEQSEPESAATYFNIEKLETIKAKLQ